MVDEDEDDINPFEPLQIQINDNLAVNASLQERSKTLKCQNDNLCRQNIALKRNITCLFKTAKLEIQRCEEKIIVLQRELSDRVVTTVTKETQTDSRIHRTTDDKRKSRHSSDERSRATRLKELHNNCIASSRTTRRGESRESIKEETKKRKRLPKENVTSKTKKSKSDRIKIVDRTDLEDGEIISSEDDTML